MGYLGYELKAECGGQAAWPPLEDASVLLLPDRYVVLDKHVGNVYTVALYEAGTSSEAANDWVDSTALIVRTYSQQKLREFAGVGGAESGWED